MLSDREDALPMASFYEGFTLKKLSINLENAFGMICTGTFATKQVATFLLENFTRLNKSRKDTSPKTPSEEEEKADVADEIKSEEVDNWDKEMDDKVKGWEQVCAKPTVVGPGAVVE